jgi:hypothetical protein
MLSARSMVYEPIHVISVLINIDSRWASIRLNTCFLFSEWAFVLTVDSLFPTFHMGLYKENILSHKSS